MKQNKYNKEYKFPDATSLRNSIFYILFFLFLVIFVAIDILPMTEEEVYERFANQELIGSSNQRFAQQIQMFLASNWGKRGLVIGMSLISFVIINEVYSMTFTLVRYRRKLKLYKKGIVTDLNDYHKPFGIIGHLKYLIKNRNKQDSSFYYKKNIRKKVEEINYDRYK